MYWKYGIAVEQVDLDGPEALNYESVTMMHLDWIDQVAVGRLLFRAIAKQVLDSAPDNLAAFTAPAKEGEPTRGVLIQPYLLNKCNAAENGSLVNYSPYVAMGPCSHKLSSVTTNRALYPQELLFHELVHALRDASGHGTALAPLNGALKGYDNMEEFVAVVVTNIFISDPTNKRADHLGLRKSHHGFTKLESALSDSKMFYSSSRRAFQLIDRFCTQDSWFTQRLAETQASFNPISVYYHDQAGARDLSNSPIATIRDVFQW